ncbi:MAG: aldo/keto reductase [Clostridia bacterium]|nr:aldo/keto reductase [Clostridia bacterium]
MNYIKVRDMNLSQIVLGTEGYDERIDRQTAFSLMDTYLANGGNVIDTARLYNEGKSEALIGDYLKGKKRDEIFVSTKCAHPLTLADLSHVRLSKEEIEDDVEKSLKALKTDYIDILWLHRDDPKKCVGPIIDTLNSLVKAGKVRHFGASNWSYDRIIEANQYAKDTNQTGFCASQALYNLATRSCVWDEKLAYIEDEKEKYDRGTLPVFAFSSQAKGFFEKYATGELSQKAKERYLNEGSIKTFEKIKERAEKENKTISSAALAMLCEQSNFDVFPIIGPSRLSQLKDTLNIR